MASGTPVIVSDRCGISAVVEDGVDGFIYPHDDIEALAEKIRWCYEHPDELGKMGAAARKKATGCGRSRFSDRVTEEIDRCIG
jgi:glycosyltransferase involved in cell wall biosynthesis